MREEAATGYPPPPELAAQARTRDWHKMTVDVRGRTVDKLVHTRDVLWYGVCPKQQVRLTSPSCATPEEPNPTTSSSPPT